MPELSFLYWPRATECEESPHAQAKRYLDGLIQRCDPDHEADHVYSRENSALALRLVELLPREPTRAYYRALFVTAPTLQADRIVITLFDIVRIVVAMYGYKVHDEQTTEDNRRDKFPLYVPMLGEFWGNLDQHQLVFEIDWDTQNLF